MKFKSFLCALCASIALGSCSYDDGELWTAVNDQESRISALEKWQATVETTLSSLQGILTATDYITGVTEGTDEDGNTYYTFTFLHSDAITLYVNDDSEVSGSSTISVGQDSNGYYWTVDGEAVTDSDGNIVYMNSSNNISLTVSEDGTYATLTIGEVSVDVLLEVTIPVVSVTEGDDATYTINLDGTTIVVPKYLNLSSYLNSEYTYSTAGGSTTHALNSTLPESYVIKILDTTFDEGWSFSVDHEQITVTYGTDPTTTTITFLISDGQTQTIMKDVTFTVSNEVAWTTITYTGTQITIPEGAAKIKVVSSSDVTAFTGESQTFVDHICTPLKNDEDVTDIDLSGVNASSCVFMTNAFYTGTSTEYNTHIKSIILPAGITAFYDRIFMNCSALESVTFTRTDNHYGADNSMNTSFDGCTLANLKIYVYSGELDWYKTNWASSGYSNLVTLANNIYAFNE